MFSACALWLYANWPKMVLVMLVTSALPGYTGLFHWKARQEARVLTAHHWVVVGGYTASAPYGGRELKVFEVQSIDSKHKGEIGIYSEHPEFNAWVHRIEFKHVILEFSLAETPKRGWWVLSPTGTDYVNFPKVTEMKEPEVLVVSPGGSI